MERNGKTGGEEPLYNIGDETGEQTQDAEGPLYQVEEEDAAEVYCLTDEEDMPENISRSVKKADDKDTGKASAPIAVMFKTMFTPVEGWKALKRAKFQPDKVMGSLLSPCVALASVSEFMAFVYEANVTLTEVLVRAVVTFMAFFFSYYSVLAAVGILMGETVRKTLNSPFGKNFIMTSMTTLPVFYMLYRLLPILGPVLVFLPLWTIYIVFRGVRFLRLPKEKDNVATVLLCALEIGMPILWNWVFTDLIPLG